LITPYTDEIKCKDVFLKIFHEKLIFLKLTLFSVEHLTENKSTIGCISTYMARLKRNLVTWIQTDLKYFSNSKKTFFLWIVLDDSGLIRIS